MIAVPLRPIETSISVSAPARCWGLQGLGTVYMEVLSIPPITNMRRPVVESLFAVNDANANCVGVSAC